MLILPISFFQASNSGHTRLLYRRHRALKPRFEKVLSAFLHIVVQNFGNNKSWPFEYHCSKLLLPAKIGFCAESIEHWIFALRRFLMVTGNHSVLENCGSIFHTDEKSNTFELVLQCFPPQIINNKFCKDCSKVNCGIIQGWKLWFPIHKKATLFSLLWPA